MNLSFSLPLDAKKPQTDLRLYRKERKMSIG